MQAYHSSLLPSSYSNTAFQFDKGQNNGSIKVEVSLLKLADLRDSRPV